MSLADQKKTSGRQEDGNVLFMILLSIALLGLLTAAMRYSSNSSGAGISKEKLLLNMTEVRHYATELEHGVNLVMQNGYSEVDIRFSHPDASSDYGDLDDDSDPGDQVFHRDGGAATYRSPPSGIQVTFSPWEFYGGTALPDVGTDRPELIAVLPNVTENFCEKINEVNGYDFETQPADTGASTANSASAGGCLYGGDAARFGDSVQFYDSPSKTPNTTDETSFSHTPAMEGCVKCSSDENYHFFHVLMAR